MKIIILCIFGFWGVLTADIALADSSKSPLAREFQIELDATALNPPIVWAIAGVTEPIQALRPLTTDKKTTLKLRPGRYNYNTSRFSFEFTVDLEGKLDFRKTLDQCIEGRGTALLIVKCSHTQPL